MRWRRFQVFLAIVLMIQLVAPPTPTSSREPAGPGVQPAAAASEWRESLSLDRGYVAVPAAATPALAGEWSAEAWAFPTSVSGCGAVLGKDFASGLWFGLCGGRLRFHRGTAPFVESAAVVPANQWSHLAASAFYDQETGGYVAVLFINGEREGFYPLEGDATVGGARELRIGNDHANDYWPGYLAEVRLWGYARGEGQIRRDMHTTLDPAPAGLLAAWRLTNGSLADSVSGAAGLPVGGVSSIGYVSPALPPTTPVDALFGALPAKTYGAGAVYLPRTDEALLLGGVRGGAMSGAITAVAAGSGAAAPRGSLPAGLFLPAAAYAESNDTVYVFGGSTSLSPAPVATIHAVNPATGAVRTLAATLPQAAYAQSAAYYAPLNKILLLGGYRLPEGALSSVLVFDVASETISTAGFALPQPLDSAPAVYSAATQAVYLLGGANSAGAQDAIVRVSLAADGLGGAAAALPARLPIADARAAAFEDPRTGLIYLAGGEATTRVVAFDPVTGEIWRTPLELPTASANTAGPVRPTPASRILPYASAVYSPRQRHALMLGGGRGGSDGVDSIWRIPLGDGPLVKLGRWDFASFAGGPIQSIDGAGGTLLVGGDGMRQFSERPGQPRATPEERFYPSGTAVGAVSWDEAAGAAAFAAGKNVYQALPDGGTRLLYDGGAIQYGGVIELEPVAGGPPAIGRNTQGNIVPSINMPNGTLSSYTYQNMGAECGQAWAIEKSPRFTPGITEYWALTQRVNSCVPSLAAQPPEDYYPRLYRMRKSNFGTTWAGADLGVLCNAPPFFARSMAVGANGDLWAGGTTGVCRYPADSLPDSGAPVFNVFDLPYAGAANNASVDSDGRVWFSTDGGLSAFEVRGGGAVRASDWSHLNAPIGRANGPAALGALAAVGEKVFAARGSTLFSLAQRWGQVDPGGAISAVWLARGRLFAASPGMLHVLQPDGATWLHQAADVHAVRADRSGRIWVGHAGGAQLWSPDGAWAAIPGLDLAEPVYALAEDAAGRMWLGLGDGVALYDRQRLVARLATPAGALPVTRLVAAADQSVWAGTANGLARLDPATSAWTHFTVANGGLPAGSGDAIADLIQRPNGAMVASTAGGLVALAPGAASFALIPGGAPAPIASDELGRLWAGNSVETGPGAWQWHYWTNSVIRSSSVSALAADQSDRVWFAHPGGGISVRGAFLPPLAESVPVITGALPGSGSAGNIIKIIGSGFGGFASDIEVEIGGARAAIVSIIDTQIEALVSPESVSGAVSVRRGGRRTILAGTPGAPAFCAIPQILDASPDGTNVGGLIQLYGTNFDPTATLQLGGGQLRQGVLSPQHAALRIAHGDSSGDLVLRNRCPNARDTEFDLRTYTLSINKIQLNQGYGGFGPAWPLPLSLANGALWLDNATLASAFVTADRPLRPQDRLQFDSIRARIGAAGLPRRVEFTRAITNGVIPWSAGPPNPGIYRDVANAVNLPNIIYGGTGLQPFQETEVEITLIAGGLTVASASTIVSYHQAAVAKVLLVPVVPDGMSQADLNRFKAETDRELGDVRHRLFPGGLRTVWAADAVPLSAVTSAAALDLGDGANFSRFGVRAEQIRQRYNAQSSDPIAVPFGMIAPTVPITGGAAGMASLGTLAAWRQREACAGQIGIAGDFFATVCGEEFPQFLGWGIGGAGAGRIMGHEIAHMMGLVQPTAANYANYGGSGGDFHSRLSERITATGAVTLCSSLPGTMFAPSLTLVRQPGVSEPIVNALSGEQYNGALADTPAASADRAKGLVSYVCDQRGDNTFLEPADLAHLQARRFGMLRPFYQPGRATSLQRPRGDEPDRIHVSGLIAPAGPAGSISHVEWKPPAVSLSADYRSGYELVQRDAGGAELARHGVLPVFNVPAHSHAAGEPVHSHAGEGQIGRFSAMLAKAPGVARIDLAAGDATFATWSAGPGAPSVTITSPLGGGAWAGGAIPLSWEASDPDGDPLAVSVEWSRDDGATWLPVASAEGGGSLAIPVERLAGSQAGRLRVWASDGLQFAAAVSEPFSVADQPPLPAITAPARGAIFGEGAAVALLGGASDPQDGAITGTLGLRWSSDRDGDLGGGEALAAPLSAGPHTLTLAATNSAGLVATSSITVTITPDYDGDGLADADEAAPGLSPLSPLDALADADGDGLSYRVERSRDTDPEAADSDGDGRSDSAELADGSDPRAADSPPADALSVWPPALAFEIDLAVGGQLPQLTLAALSRATAPVTLTTDAPWLDLSAARGATPLIATLVVNPSLLANGRHTATLTVTSALGTVAVPVVANVRNKQAFCDADQSGTLDAADTEEVRGRLGSAAGDAGYAYQADLNRDGRIDAADLALASGCVLEFDPSRRRLYLPLLGRSAR